MESSSISVRCVLETTSKKACTFAIQLETVREVEEMNTSDFRTTGAVWTEEPEEDHANTATSETRMQDDDTELAEATLDRWDQDKWAENIMKQ